MAAVTAIVRHGNTVFAGGALAGKLVSGVAAFDATSGRKLWQVSADENGVNSLAFADGVLFVGGSFLRIAGVRRDGIAALDPQTGKPTPWRPGQSRRKAGSQSRRGRAALRKGHELEADAVPDSLREGACRFRAERTRMRLSVRPFGARTAKPPTPGS